MGLGETAVTSGCPFFNVVVGCTREAEGHRGRGVFCITCIVCGCASKQIYDPGDPHGVSLKVLSLYGSDMTVATDTAHSIVASSLRGIDSHGINLLPKIVGRVTNKDSSGEMLSQVAEPAELVVPGDGLPVGVVDAKLSPGQHACLFAARVAADKAEKFGIGMVPVRNSTHFGSCAPFLEEVVRRGFVCMVGSNSTQTMSVFGAPRANLGRWKPHHLATTRTSFLLWHNRKYALWLCRACQGRTGLPF